MSSKLQSATVIIQSVRESRTKGTVWRPEGQRRFTIVATYPNGDVGLTTLDAWKASLCDQARMKGQRVAITFRDTGFFDKSLVSVELAKQKETA